MKGDKIIEVNNFKLYYDGLFIVKFEYLKEKYVKPLYLTPDILFKIFQKEGLDNLDSFQSLDFYSEGVCFSKTTLLFDVFDSNEGRMDFVCSEFTEPYQDSDYYLIDCIIKEDV